jgi:membrane protease YdiL (CAAX protease family)
MQILHGRYLSVRRRVPAVLALAGTVALPLVHLDLPLPVSMSPEAVRLIVVWGWAAVLAALVFGWERRPLKFLQLRGFRLSAAGEALATLIAAMVLSGLIRQLVVPGQPSSPPDEDAEMVALWIRLVLALSAGITEEFMFRGFLIEEGGELLRSRRLAAVLAAIGFAAGHWDRGWVEAFIGPGIIGVAFTVIYFRQKSLPLCMLMHSMIDVCYELLH